MAKNILVVTITAQGDGANEATSTQTIEYETLDELIERVTEHFRKDVPNLHRAIPKVDEGARVGEPMPISVDTWKAREKHRTESEARRRAASSTHPPRGLSRRQS